MTAKSVNGVEVVFDEPAQAPLTNPKTGEPILHINIRHLLLADGTETYGCAKCDYTNKSPWGVRPHLKVHKREARENNVPGPVDDFVPSSIRVEETPMITILVNGAPLYEVMDRLQDYDRLARDPAEAQRRLHAVDGIQADRDKWKARAQKAERDLKNIRSALGVS